MTTRKQQKAIDEAELDLVRRIARAQARANGHSHPDEHADRVVAAYKGELEPPDEPGSEDADEQGETSSGGEV
jgi:hypothetical protein